MVDQSSCQLLRHPLGCFGSELNPGGPFNLSNRRILTDSIPWGGIQSGRKTKDTVAALAYLKINPSPCLR